MSDFCPECLAVIHASHSQEVGEVIEEVAAEQANVEIARIEAERDITLAKINKGIALEEIAAGVMAQEAVNELQAEVIDELTAPDAEVIIMDAGEAPAEEMAEEEPVADAPEAMEEEPVHSSANKQWSYWG